jgi:hypothetical protein
VKKDTESVVPLATTNCIINSCNISSTETVLRCKILYSGELASQYNSNK